jgi:hypothetical protein
MGEGGASVAAIEGFDMRPWFPTYTLVVECIFWPVIHIRR